MGNINNRLGIDITKDLGELLNSIDGYYLVIQKESIKDTGIPPLKIKAKRLLGELTAMKVPESAFTNGYDSSEARTWIEDNGNANTYYWYGSEIETPEGVFLVDSGSNVIEIKFKSNINRTYVDSVYGSDISGQVHDYDKKFKTIGAAETAVSQLSGKQTVIAYGDFIEDSSELGIDGITEVFGNLELTGGAMRDFSDYKLKVHGTISVTTSPTVIPDSCDKFELNYDVLDLTTEGSTYGEVLRVITSDFTTDKKRDLKFIGNIYENGSIYQVGKLGIKPLLQTSVSINGEWIESNNATVLISGKGNCYVDFDRLKVDCLTDSSIHDTSLPNTDDWGCINFLSSKKVRASIRDVVGNVGFGFHTFHFFENEDAILYDTNFNVSISDGENYVYSCVVLSVNNNENVESKLIVQNCNFECDINNGYIFSNAGTTGFNDCTFKDCTFNVAGSYDALLRFHSNISNYNVFLRNLRVNSTDASAFIATKTGGDLINFRIEDVWSNIDLFGSTGMIDVWYQEYFYLLGSSSGGTTVSTWEKIQVTLPDEPVIVERFYHELAPEAKTYTDVKVSLAQASSSGDVVVEIFKNGTSVENITITQGNNKSTKTISISYAVDDVVELKVTTAQIDAEGLTYMWK